MRKIFYILVIIFTIASAFVITTPSAKPAQAYSNSNMIDDAVFDNSLSMSTPQIQSFLNQFPNSCLKNYTDEYPNDYFSYGGPVSAATIIRRASDLWGINPQVMLTKLEQEENLVTGNAGCPLYRYVSAVGFDCPGPTRDTVFRGVPVTTCVKNDVNMGFARQVTKGAWLLKWGKERALGNLNWLTPDDAAYYYVGPMTQGTFKRSSGSTAVYYDGYWNGVHLGSGATASLYNYTPYLGQAFPSIFEGFFGTGSTSSLGIFPSTAIFRLYSPTFKEHFFTSSPTERDYARSVGYTYEGLAFYSDLPGTGSPVYRMYSPSLKKHFYTASAYERDQAVARAGYVYEAVAFTVDLAATPGSLAVYRIYSPSQNDHHFTTSVFERDSALRNAGYLPEGIVWYAH